MLAATAYFVRGLQMVLKTSKRGTTERAEELGNENDEIPLTQGIRTQATTFDTPSAATSTLDVPSLDQTTDLVAQPRAQDPAQVRGTGGPPAEAGLSQTVLTSPPLRQDPIPLTRAQKWAAIINVNLDVFTYGTLFLCAGIPIYYATGYAMPVQLTLNVLAYFAALSLPARSKRVLHPVLVSSAITILGIWILALCGRDTLHDGLRAYSTKTRYLQLWDGDKGLREPGAGDVFSSVLDVSIVALALPMFQYRNELKRHVSATTSTLHPVSALVTDDPLPSSSQSSSPTSSSPSPPCSAIPPSATPSASPPSAASPSPPGASRSLLRPLRRLIWAATSIS